MNLTVTTLPEDGTCPKVSLKGVKIRQIALWFLAAFWFVMPMVNHAMTVTSAGLTGVWDLRTVCMSNGGKPGACIEMKIGSLQFTFGSGGKWTSEANDQSHTQKAGTFEAHGDRLILKLTDGSQYQNWHAELTQDDKQLIVTDKKLVETFERPKSAQ